MVSILACFVFVSARPATIGDAWHLFNGKAAVYRGWTVPVPKGFFAFERNGSLSLGRFRRISLTPGRRFDLILIADPDLKTQFVYDRDFRKYEQLEAASANRMGLIESATRVLRVGKSIRYCVEFRRSDLDLNYADTPEVEISCFIDGEDTTITYWGRRMFTSEVYSITQNMSKMSTPEETDTGAIK